MEPDDPFGPDSKLIPGLPAAQQTWHALLEIPKWHALQRAIAALSDDELRKVVLAGVLESRRNNPS